MSNDWREHPGGPQPVGDDVWVEVQYLIRKAARAESQNWTLPRPYRILNQHLILGALKRGIELGLKAAIEYTDNVAEESRDFEGNEVEAFIYERHARGLRTLDPETIAKATQGE